MPWWEAVGWAGSALVVASLLQTRLVRLRVLNSIACAVLVAYNAAVGVWPMVAMNVVLVGINPWAITRPLRGRHDPRVYDAVPGGHGRAAAAPPAGPARGDIVRFNPDLDGLSGADLAGRADHAFVVSTADNGRRCGARQRRVDIPGEQQVLLDYVLRAVPGLHAGRVRVPARRAVPGPGRDRG